MWFSLWCIILDLACLLSAFRIEPVTINEPNALSFFFCHLGFFWHVLLPLASVFASEVMGKAYAVFNIQWFLQSNFVIWNELTSNACATMSNTGNKFLIHCPSHGPLAIERIFSNITEVSLYLLVKIENVFSSHLSTNPSLT